MVRAQPLLGTLVEIGADGRGAHVHEALDDAFRAIERVHALMSFHDENSDVGRMNRAAHIRTVTVHAWTWRVLKTAERLYRATDGAFDCAIAPELVRRGVLPDACSAETRSMRGATYDDVMVVDRSRVRFRRPLAVDLGGIAKGFAVDQAVRTLKRAGIRSGVVNAGGDLRAFGRAKRVHVRDPRNPGATGVVGELHEAAIATSASYFLERARTFNTSAIVDPHRKRRVTFPASVSVIAPTCMIADALTKVVAIAGHQHGLSRWRARAIVL